MKSVHLLLFFLVPCSALTREDVVETLHASALSYFEHLGSDASLCTAVGTAFVRALGNGMSTWAEATAKAEDAYEYGIKDGLSFSSPACLSAEARFHNLLDEKDKEDSPDLVLASLEALLEPVSGQDPCALGALQFMQAAAGNPDFLNNEAALKSTFKSAAGAFLQASMLPSAVPTQACSKAGMTLMPTFGELARADTMGGVKDDLVVVNAETGAKTEL